MKFGLIFVFKAVPKFAWFRLSSWRPGFKAGQFVWRVLDSSVAVGKVLVLVLRFPHSAPFHHSCIYLNNRTCLETIKQYSVLSDTRERQSENYSNVLFFRLYSVTVISLAIPWPSISVSDITGTLVRTENIRLLYYTILQLRCRFQWPRGLRRSSAAARLLRLWVRFPPGWHGCLSVVSVVCCQVEVSATSSSPVQRGTTDCGASFCVI